MNLSAGDGEIWLRGNLRPVGGLVAAAGALAGLGLIVAGAVGAPVGLRWAVAGGGAAAVGAAVALAVAAARPRLQRRGGLLRVRLMPLVTHDVPLDVVECVFLGSRPLHGDSDEAEGGQRVATLVMRIAERAVDWQSRPTFRAWGTWDEGNVVFDGRWCEPLSGDVARQVAGRLLEARRAIVPAGSPSPGIGP